MKRRKFITAAAGGVAASALAAPAIAQAPTVRWRITTSWPKSLDTIYGSVELIAKRVAGLTEGKFEIRVFAAGEIVPGLQVLDAVQNRTVEAGHSYSAFYFGKRPAYAFDGGLAFGLNTRQTNAWMYYGGGLELVREVFKKDGVITLPCGSVGVQMGGFYKKEINTVDDLKGLKMRIGGLGGRILAKLGAIPQQIPPGDLYPALERGTIDAAEFIGPHDDEKLGLHKVTKYYYTPGWWEGSAQNSMLVNLAAWEALPPAFKEAFEVACNEQGLLAVAKYDVVNPPALNRLAASGLQIKQFPRPVLDAAYQAAFELFDELAAQDADFKKIYTAWKAFLEESNLWFRVAEFSLDSYRLSKPLPK
ncbi:MAG: ABC transporter substrate-binding protein [Proteobacteria bacterium]|nr:ABC transporter substrate-binding protein [Pseudomonadota bacterium]